MAREIPLTKGFVAIVDEADYARVSAKKWSVTITRWGPRALHYWKAGGRKCVIGLGPFVMGVAAPAVVDHISGDTLDNRRANLRVCTGAQNSMNRKASRRAVNPNIPFKGVTVQRGRYFARIQVARRALRLGGFDTAADAARAYDAAARIHHGEFARLNFPEAA